MQAGDVLDGRFRIERQAGSGAMGVVLRAHDLHTDVPVAIKVLKGDRKASARFQREARVLAQLSHPTIVRYVAHGSTASGAMFLAMEWLEGVDLSERLTRGPLGVAEALDLASRVADALATAHARGIVHRDLKPSNLFLPADDTRSVKLLDFGIARVQNATFGMTVAGSVIGTPGYMAPEQARGDAVIDARADVFSLGCVLFECLTGRAAFAGENIMAVLVKILMEEPPRASELCPSLPAAIDDIIAAMLAKSPAQRPADGAAAREAIAGVEALAAAMGDAPAPRRHAITRGEQHVVSVVIAAGRPSSEARLTSDDLTNETHADLAALPASLDDLTSSNATATSPSGGAGLASGPADGLARTELDVPRRAHPLDALDALARFGAHVEQLADGAIVATLHGAGAATDQAAQAARCALALRAMLPDAPLVLATGRAVFAGRLPIGQVIERAAKLLRAVSQGANEDDGAPIHLDDVTAGLLPSRFRVRYGAFGAELTGEQHSADVARTVLGKTTRFVGRDAEIGTLMGVYAQVESDAVPRAIIVTGAPGLGKSRLREELVARLRDRGPAPEIWMGAAEPLGAGMPLGILARLVRSAIGVTEGAAGVDGARSVERMARRVAATDKTRVATFLGELVGAPLDVAPSLPHEEVQLQAARREPRLMAEQMQRAFVELLRAECASQPVVLVLEDAQWADLPSMKLVDAALRELPESALLVVAFARPEIEDAFPGLWADRSVLRLSLSALTPRAAERLARDVLGADADAEMIRRLVAQAGGNPFFVEELVRSFGSGAPGTMPPTLLAMVQKRIEGLDEELRRALRAASVYGGVFWRGAAAALLGGEAGIDVDRCLAELVDREVVVRHAESRMPGEIEYGFRHALVCDAAYEMLTDADRALGHRFAGEWLETAGEVNRALVAEHFERGLDKVRATQNYALAAAQALHADDLDGCLRLAKRGLATADHEADARGALHLARAEAHHWRAEFDEAYAEVTEALHLLERGSDEWYAASAIAVAACATLGRPQEATALAAELASASADRRPAFLMAAAQCVAFLPSEETGDGLLALLPAATAAVPDPLLAARVHVARAMRAQARGDGVLVLEQFASAAEAFDRAGHLRGARSARANAGYASTELGRHEEAEQALRHAVADARRAGALTTVAWATMHLGMVLGRLGRPTEALVLADEARALARVQGNRRLEAEVAVVTADILNASGAPELAIEHARSVGNAADVPALQAAALSALATALVARGEAEAAHNASREALRIVETERGARDVEPVVRLAHAMSLHALGRRGDAVDAIRAAKSAVLVRAGAIADPQQRETFLRRILTNARILDLAKAWSGPET